MSQQSGLHLDIMVMQHCTHRKRFINFEAVTKSKKRLKNYTNSFSFASKWHLVVLSKTCICRTNLDKEQIPATPACASVLASLQ